MDDPCHIGIGEFNFTLGLVLGVHFYYVGIVSVCFVRASTERQLPIYIFGYSGTSL